MTFSLFLALLVGIEFNIEQFAVQFRLACTLTLITCDSFSLLSAKKTLKALTLVDHNSTFNSIHHHYHLCCHHQDPLLQQWAAQTVECLPFSRGFYRTAGRRLLYRFFFRALKFIIIAFCSASTHAQCSS